MQNNYVVLHLHDDTSNCNGYLDSCTNYKDYIDLAVNQKMKAIAFTNHGGIFDWVNKKLYCDKKGIKYIHGIEMYLCTKLEANERGYHLNLYAKNFDGVKELNSLYSLSTSKGIREDNTDRQYYYNPRISIEQLMQTSSNIMITSACLASIFWKEKDSMEVLRLLTWMKLNSNRCFLEIQYHSMQDQIEYNQLLYKWSVSFEIRLIAGTDTHSSNTYKAQCRKILQKSRFCDYDEEEEMDLTWKTYEELVNCFNQQEALTPSEYLQAIDNTNMFADLVEDFELDRTFKYPNLYGDDADNQWKSLISNKLKYKLANGIINKRKLKQYKTQIVEEFNAMSKQGMSSFMLFMAELVQYCNDQAIPYGYCRGSVGGSVIAYITDITDVDPIVWNTIFSRFCNAERVSLAD
jgi:DNA polymerase-3 subunit alpha